MLIACDNNPNDQQQIMEPTCIIMCTSIDQQPLSCSCQVTSRKESSFRMILGAIHMHGEKNNQRRKKTKTTKRYLVIKAGKNVNYFNYFCSIISFHGFLNFPYYNTQTTTTFKSFNSSAVSMAMPFEQIVRL